MCPKTLEAMYILMNISKTERHKFTQILLVNTCLFSHVLFSCQQLVLLSASIPHPPQSPDRSWHTFFLQLNHLNTQPPNGLCLKVMNCDWPWQQYILKGPLNTYNLSDLAETTISVENCQLCLL